MFCKKDPLETGSTPVSIACHNQELQKFEIKPLALSLIPNRRVSKGQR